MINFEENVMPRLDRPLIIELITLGWNWLLLQTEMLIKLRGSPRLTSKSKTMY